MGHPSDHSAFGLDPGGKMQGGPQGSRLTVQSETQLGRTMEHLSMAKDRRRQRAGLPSCERTLSMHGATPNPSGSGCALCLPAVQQACMARRLAAAAAPHGRAICAIVQESCSGRNRLDERHGGGVHGCVEMMISRETVSRDEWRRCGGGVPEGRYRSLPLVPSTVLSAEGGLSDGAVWAFGDYTRPKTRPFNWIRSSARAKGAG